MPDHPVGWPTFPASMNLSLPIVGCASISLAGWLVMGVIGRADAATAPLSIQRSGASEVQISWFAVSGLSYQLQTNTDLASAWVDFDDPILGTGSTVSVPASTAGNPRRFFRLEPPPPDVITAVFSPATGILTITGGGLANTILISRDSGLLRINGGGVPITGGSPTVTNTTRIDVLGREGDDEIALDERTGPLPPARVFGEGGHDIITGGSSADFLDGGTGNDSIFGKGGGDDLTGGDDQDSLVGGDGDDQVSGGNHDDQFIWNPGDDTDLHEGDSGSDTLTVNAGNGAETFTTSANGTRVRFDRLTPAPFSLDIGTVEKLVVNTNGGDDAFSATGNLAALIQLTVNGGAGNDTLLGSNGADVLNGGDDTDLIDGQQANDIIFAGNGDDVIQWDPGDGSDTVEGQGGLDTLLFNASAAGEIIAVSPNGGRVTLSRNVGAILMDLDDVETLDLNLLGGVDTFTVNNLAGTDLVTVIADLAATGGAGDAAVDIITLNGTSAPDIISLTAAPSQVNVTGLPATVRILQPEVANDDLIINGLGGTDIFAVGGGVTGLIGVTTNQ